MAHIEKVACREQKHPAEARGQKAAEQEEKIAKDIEELLNKD
jgi:predicted component of type VI protein secretion system